MHHQIPHPLPPCRPKKITLIRQRSHQQPIRRRAVPSATTAAAAARKGRPGVVVAREVASRRHGRRGERARRERQGDGEAEGLEAAAPAGVFVLVAGGGSGGSGDCLAVVNKGECAGFLHGVVPCGSRRSLVVVVAVIIIIPAAATVAATNTPYHRNRRRRRPQLRQRLWRGAKRESSALSSEHSQAETLAPAPLPLGLGDDMVLGSAGAFRLLPDVDVLRIRMLGTRNRRADWLRPAILGLNDGDVDRLLVLDRGLPSGLRDRRRWRFDDAGLRFRGVSGPRGLSIVGKSMDVGRDGVGLEGGMRVEVSGDDWLVDG